MPEPLKHLVAWLWQHWPYTTAAVVVIVYLIVKIFPVLKGLLGLKKQTLDIKKADLEVRELERKETTVKLASLDEIKTYDPTTRKLIERSRVFYDRVDSEWSYFRTIMTSLFWIILLLAGILGALWAFHKLLGELKDSLE